jgi:hypothetical protein
VPHASPGSGGDSRAILLRTAHTSSFPPFGEAFPQTRFLLADPRSPPSATRPGSTFWHLPAALLYDGTVVRRVFLSRPHTDSGIAFSWAGTHAIGDVFQLPNFPTSQLLKTPRLPGSQAPRLPNSPCLCDWRKAGGGERKPLQSGSSPSARLPNRPSGSKRKRFCEIVRLTLVRFRLRVADMILARRQRFKHGGRDAARQSKWVLTL